MIWLRPGAVPTSRGSGGNLPLRVTRTVAAAATCCCGPVGGLREAEQQRYFPSAVPAWVGRGRGEIDPLACVRSLS